MCFLEFGGSHCSALLPFCMHSRDPCQGYYSEQTMSSLSEARMNSITKFSSSVQPALPPTLVRTAREGRPGAGSPLPAFQNAKGGIMPATYDLIREK